LFENIVEDSLDNIKRNIAQDVRNYFPRVNPTLLEILSTPDSNQIRFYMAYQIVDTNIEDQLLINIEQ
jgi:hypothetical protein